MNWRIGPWRENFILKERLAHHERWLEQVKANADFWKAEWGQMYRALMASQKGCVGINIQGSAPVQSVDNVEN